MRRVVVTGMGVVCACGLNCGEFGEALRAGRSGIGEVDPREVQDIRFRMGGVIPGFVATDYMDAKQADMLDRFAQLALVAAREAVRQSGIAWTPELRDTAAIVTGSCVGGQSTEDRGFHDVYKLGRPRVHPMTIPKTMANAGASAISLEFGITGPVFTVATACASSAHAIGQAVGLIRAGMTDVAITGGSEAPFSYGILKAWEAMRVVSPGVCRPFSADRSGMLLGEAGAMLVIEELEHARARGARSMAEIAGIGMSSDAHHITQPSAEGAAKAIARALRDAGMAPGEVQYVNAHGTGTAANDVTETRALHLAFGGHAGRLAVSSTKAMHGHTLGAAGALETVATILGMTSGVVAPTINYTTPDAECDLDYVPNEARRLDVECALSSSFAFGGLNAVIALRKVW